MTQADAPVSIAEVKAYWHKKHIPQQWYSRREPYTLAWFNELEYKRHNVYYPHILEDFEFEYHKGDRILEIGCGLGTELALFAKNGAIVNAIDLGPDQVKLARLNLELRNLPYEEIREASAENLPFPDESFDFVYSIGVIHHTPDTEQTVREMYRVLKPGGKAIVFVYARGWKHYIKRCLITGLLKGRWFKYGFNWQKVYDEASEVYGFSPKTGVYTKRQAKKLFSIFPTVTLQKRRMGEFFEYKPYNTVMLPKFVNNFCKLLNLESLLGEDWTIKATKSEHPKEASLWEVMTKHY